MREILLRIGRDLPTVFKDAQEEVLWGLQGDVFALVATYKLACMGIRRKEELPAFKSLPLRIRVEQDDKPGMSRCGSVVSQRNYMQIRARLYRALQNAADVKFTVVPSQGKRSVESIMAEVDRITKATADHQRGPHARPVWCEALTMWFRSTRAAAEHLNDHFGTKVKRSHIRTAIVRGSRCAGHKWSYDGPSMNKPPSGKLITNGKAIPIRLIIEGKPEEFDSMVSAARRIGVCDLTLKRALHQGDGRAQVKGAMVEYIMPGDSASLQVVKPVELLWAGVTVVKQSKQKRVREDRRNVSVFEQRTLEFAGMVA